MCASFQNERHLAKNITSKAVIVFILSASFYLYEYILQVAPSVMVREIMQSFHVGAEGVGTISAFYYYAYAPMQLPAGVLFDYYGPRLLITVATCVCAIGAIFFALTKSVFMASLGRFLIGFGSAFSFIGILILVYHWFPAKRFAMMVGIAQFMSSLGAIFGEIPLAFLSKELGWRQATMLLAGLGFVLALLVWKIVKNSPDGQIKSTKNKKSSVLNEWRKLHEVCQKPQTWAVGFYAFCSWTPITILGALWIVPYLKTLYHVDTIVAAKASTMIWLGIGFGSPFLGWFSDKIRKRKLPLSLSMVIGLLSSTWLIIGGQMSWGLMYLTLFIFGMSASGQALSFALVKENNTSDYVGTASGFNNASVLIGGAIFQPLFGYVLKYYWQGETLNHIPIYGIEAYFKALYVIPCFYIAALLALLFFIKEPKMH